MMKLRLYLQYKIYNSVHLPEVDFKSSHQISAGYIVISQAPAARYSISFDTLLFR